MSGVLMSEAKKKEGYSLGDLVHIRGKIKIFRGEREVVASYHSILCCNFKPCHMCTYWRKLPLRILHIIIIKVQVQVSAVDVKIKSYEQISDLQSWICDCQGWSLCKFLRYLLSGSWTSPWFFFLTSQWCSVFKFFLHFSKINLKIPIWK